MAYNDHLSFIEAYESGELESTEEMIEGFQKMIDDGMVWKLQGSYGRTAVALMAAGLCHDSRQSFIEQAAEE